MKYKQDFEKAAAEVAAIASWSIRKEVCEGLIETFRDSNPLFFAPLFRHACRVEFISREDMTEAKTRWLMLKEDEGPDNWYIFDLEKHLMVFSMGSFMGSFNISSYNLSKKDKELLPINGRKVPKKWVNGYYWNQGSSTQNQFEATQTGRFLSEYEPRFGLFEGQPWKTKRDHSNYDPYKDDFVDPYNTEA